MRRISSFMVVVLALAGLAVVVPAGPASAAISCRWSESGHVKFRNCAVSGSRFAGTVDGGINWSIAPNDDGQGAVNIHLESRRPGAGCNVIRVRYRNGTRPNETRVARACNGRARNVSFTLNLQYVPYADGTFYVDWCEAKTRRSKLRLCDNVWLQRVDDPGPNL